MMVLLLEMPHCAAVFLKNFLYKEENGNSGRGKGYFWDKNGKLSVKEDFIFGVYISFSCKLDFT